MKWPARFPQGLWWLTWCVVVCSCAVGQTQTTQPAGHRLTVMAYNVKNMFDVFDDPYSEDERTGVKKREELVGIARVIKHYKPDIVAFQEIENEGVLQAMAVEMLQEEGYRYLTVMPTNTGRGINLGVMSKQPILSLTSHRFQELTLEGENRTWRFARDLLRVRIQATEQHVLELFIVHFKSRISSAGDPDSAKWRLAEATAARRIIDDVRQHHSPDWVLMVGDFNDYPDSPTLKALLEGQPHGQPPLVDVLAGLDPEKRITYLEHPYRSTIDHILASPDLAKRLAPDSAIVPEEGFLLAGSDHAPVIASFDLSP